MKYSLFLIFLALKSVVCLILAVLGLHCCEGCSLAVLYGFLFAVASVVATPGL